MSRGPDAATLLRRALERDADARGCDITVDPTELRRWASATFTGARQRLTITGPDAPALDAWVALLPELDLPLRNHLVADVTVLGVVRHGGVATVTVEALTVET